MAKTYNLGRVTNGFIIMGYYNDLAALQAAISSPSIGDAYGVGSAAPYTIYVWDGSWVDNGNLQGPKGDPSTIPGPAGQDGLGIKSIQLKSTVGKTKTYRITFDDDTYFDYNVVDGADGAAGAAGTDGTSYYVWIKWSAAQPDSDDDISDTPNDYMGIYSGPSSTAPTAWNAYTWYKVKGADADIAAIEDYIDNYIDEVILGGAS